MATATKYLLPCSCGQRITIDIAQAGQQITCACGQSLEVPTMRGIRALEPAPEASEEAKSAPRSAAPAWSSLQGALFGIGLMTLFLAGCVAAYNGLVMSQIVIQEPTASDFERADAAFDALPPEKMYDVYVHARDQGLGTPQTPDYVIAKRVKAYYQRLMIGALVVSGVGAVIAASAFLLPGRPASAAARR